MRILFITPSVPSPLHRVRALNILRVLAVDHDVRLVALAPSHDPASGDINLPFLARPPRIVPHSFAASCLSCARALPTREPLELAYCRSRAFRATVREEIETFAPDIVYVKRLRSVVALPDALPCPVLLDVTDAMAASYRRAAPEAPLHLRPLFWREARTYAHAERTAAARFSHWVTASLSDAALLQRAFPRLRLHVAPNVADTTQFVPVPPAAEEKHLMLFSGLMDKVVNVSAVMFFIREILPRIRDLVPDARLIIAGPKPPRAVRALARVPGVTVTGYVQDLRMFLARAAVVVVPIRIGTGTRNKILQAWAMGKAIVSTSIGAAGLPAAHGENLLLADTPEAFADATTLLLQDPSLRRALSVSGRATVERAASLPVLARALDAALASATAVRAI